MSSVAGRAGATAGLVLLTAALAGAAGCSNQPAPANPSTAAGAAAAGQAAAPDGDQPANTGEATAGDPSAAPPAGRPAKPTDVTIEPAGGRGEEPRTLGEAARAARARRGDQPKAGTVITNENLSDYAARGQVTLAPEPAGDPGAAGTAGAEPTGAEPGSGGPRDEAYWRDRALDLRKRWAASADEIERLEKETADLRWAFYAEDDPYYRDERIKPAWDRALDDLRRARQDERFFREQVGDLMEEGRAAGALPGWLREGLELEPEEAGKPDAPIGREPRSTEPIEPPGTGEDRPR